MVTKFPMIGKQDIFQQLIKNESRLSMKPTEELQY